MPEALPPLNALRAFEAAARHLSFTRAAHELHVTQTAISHQMRLLEAHLGQRLFLRLPRRLMLTAAGQAYARELAAVFDRIREATAGLHAEPARELLTVTVVPSFGTLWLVPRLGRWVAAAPRIDLRIVATERPLDFSREPVDVGIRFGYGRYPGLRAEKLTDDEWFPLCSPRLLRGRGRLRAPADLRRQVLLHDESPHAWRRWLRAFGAADLDADRGHVFSDASMMLQAAADGQGVAMGRGMLAARHLAARRLVRPLAGSLPSDQSYFLVTSEQSADLPRVRAFRAWIVEEIAGLAPG